MIRLRVAGGILIAAACAVPAAAQEESEFQELRAWVPVGTALAAPPAEGTFNLTSGVVLTPDNYGDFVLRFDYRVPAPGAGGALLVRSEFEDVRRRRSAYAYTVALTADPAGERGRGRITAERQRLDRVHYEVPATNGSTEDRWIACEVRLDGAIMQVRLDGVLVSTAEGLSSSRGRLAFEADAAGGLMIRGARIAALPEPGREHPPGQPFGTGAVARDTPGVTPAAVLRREQPRYTAEAMREGLVGVVMLDLVIGTDGQPGDVRVARSPHPDLTTLAIACLRQWRFQPAMRDGVPVALRATMEMAFTLGPKQPKK